MGKTSIESPVSSTNRDEVHLRINDTAANGKWGLLSSLDAKPNVTIAVTNCDVAFKTSSLTSRRLFLDRHDLENFVLQLYDYNVFKCGSNLASIQFTLTAGPMRKSTI